MKVYCSEIDWLAPEVPVEHPEDSCRFCGCTDDHACPGGCSWVDPAHTICSACHCRAQLLLVLPKRRKDELAAVLVDETNPNILALAFWHARGDWRRAAISRRIEELQARHG